MKTRFNTYDIVCMVAELQRLIGMRVNQVYDIDNRTYLIRLQRSEEKAVLLLESGNRFHTTQFEWPKNVAPSGFTMKLRKHLKNKRLEKLSQYGIDRIVELQFGSGEAAYHVILELYDRGNIVLTDHEWTILNVLRPHVEGDKIRFAVKEKYPLDRAKVWSEPPLGDQLKEILGKCRPGDNLKKMLNPNVEYGPAVIDHVLLVNGLSGNMKISKDKGFQMDRDLDKLDSAIRMAEELMVAAKNGTAKGYIIQKKEERPTPEGDAPTYIMTNIEFHPYLFEQHKESPVIEYETFDRAVDEFFSAVEGQKIDIKTIQLERDAMKKLQNVRKDHDKRLTELEKAQHEDREKAELITRNLEVVNNAMMAIHNALANQVSWDTISSLIKEAQDNNDPIALSIKKLKLDTNHITLELFDPYDELEPMLVDVDLSLTAYANATRYYDHKRSAAKKQQKTLESQGKALKSAERKTKQTLKEAQTISNISKARKTYWFEKFYWFISTDNYLVISGRDQQQNELLVKRYLRANDVYVHADVSGASSVVVKGGANAPNRTLNEAGQAAVAYSVAWEAKVLTSAWWVNAHQVSKSAPTGEYLSTGSFMIRGKKNYLLPQHLQMGFGFMFRLEESCIERHKTDRKPQMIEDISEISSVQDTEEIEQEIVVSDDDENSDTEVKEKETLEPISEEIPKDDSPDKPEDDPEESGSDTESSESYPDTHIKVDHETGQVVTESKIRTLSETSEMTPQEEKPLSFPSLPKKNQNKKPQKQVKFEPKKEKDGPKRGQKGKLKKIKEKYKNQDEDERALRTQLLQSTNSNKVKKNEKKNTTSGGKVKGNKGPKIPQPTPQLYEVEDEGEDPENEPQELAEGEAVDELSEMLYQLTGVPSSEDELLFSVPVVAPYSTLLGYKFKVKLTPGTSKRGKAAKTAVQVFLKDPNSSSRERDLLKAVKEENIARNFPGKVKLSAPNLHKRKK